MKKMIVAVLSGGYSSEKEVSTKSAKFVFDELDRDRFEPYLLVIDRDRWYALSQNNRQSDIDKNDFSFIIDGEKIKPEYVINIIHGTPGENGLITGYLEMMGIPYLGCDLATSAVTFDKVWTKRALNEIGIPMAKDFVIQKGDKVNCDELIDKLGLPMFIKPTASGSSFGVSKVQNMSEIEKALSYAFTESDCVICESAISGRELACGVYVTKKAEHLLPPTEIISDNAFFDYQAKYEGASKEITPADISGELLDVLNNYTLKIYKHLRCKGFVRIDYIVDGATPYLIEINSIPGMSAQSLIPQQLECAGISVNEMITEIIDF